MWTVRWKLHLRLAKICPLFFFPPPSRFLCAADNKQVLGLLILMHTGVNSIPSFSKVIPSGAADHICQIVYLLFLLHLKPREVIHVTATITDASLPLPCRISCTHIVHSDCMYGFNMYPCSTQLWCSDVDFVCCQAAHAVWLQCECIVRDAYVVFMWCCCLFSSCDHLCHSCLLLFQQLQLSTKEKQTGKNR